LRAFFRDAARSLIVALPRRAGAKTLPSKSQWRSRLSETTSANFTAVPARLCRWQVGRLRKLAGGRHGYSAPLRDVENLANAIVTIVPMLPKPRFL